MLDSVKDYYGKTLQGSADLKTDACCTPAAPPEHLREPLARIHGEVLGRYYGCGLVVPPLLEGLEVLDLGCGAGRDAYLLSALVGEGGVVVGVDMTPEQLSVAERYIDYHRDAFGYSAANVSFRLGYLERLHELGLTDASFDLIVSNCVINLCADKEAVLREALRVLKPGGELYFADVYADRRVPAALRADPVLHGECLSGAMYWRDFLSLAKRVGFTDPRLVEARPLTINDRDIAARLAPAAFSSATYRLFKLPALEPACEDYGQAVIYRGTVPEAPRQFLLDADHHIERGRVFPVCGNTWRMLHDTRFRPHFDFIGNWETHYGPFPGCVAMAPVFARATENLDSTAGGGCC
jgi:arsenite methyltransferase